MREEQVCTYLKNRCSGKQRAIKAARLGQLLRIGEKELQKAVAKLRRKGVPIASGPAGYYYAATAGEIYATIRQLKEMEKGLQSSILGLESALERFGERGVIRPE